jgi:GTP1/Obg family GTP-binding protein
MANATERVPVLMTPDEKKRVVSKAKKAGVAIGEYIRRAIDGYRPSEDEKALEAMIRQMNQATKNAEKSIDETLNFVKASNKRIEEMEAASKRGRA